MDQTPVRPVRGLGVRDMGVGDISDLPHIKKGVVNLETDESV